MQKKNNSLVFVSQKSLSLQFLQRKNIKDTPFFMMIAPPAPHAPFTPAERHTNAFLDVKAIRTPSFNYTPFNASNYTF